MFERVCCTNLTSFTSYFVCNLTKSWQHLSTFRSYCAQMSTVAVLLVSTWLINKVHLICKREIKPCQMPEHSKRLKIDFYLLSLNHKKPFILYLDCHLCHITFLSQNICMILVIQYTFCRNNEDFSSATYIS